MSFCKVDFKLKGAKTLGFSYPAGSLSFAAGEPHLKFDGQDVVSPDDVASCSYLIVGTILGVDKSGMNGTANHQFHESLSFDHQDGEEIYLKVPYSVREKAEWSGLSGSAVVRNDGKLLGMLINVSEADNLIRLMSANAILDQIRQQQRLNASGVDQTQPCIVVGSAVTMDDVRNNSAINDIINTLHGKNTHKR